MTDDLTRRSIDTIRALAMDSVQKANSGHPGTAMALAPLAFTIFTRFLRANPGDVHWADRDRFVLSAGHACILQYSLLHLTGYDMQLDDLKQFRQFGSRTPGHPERLHTPGIEVTTGPLGQGVGNAIGLVLAERYLAERFNRPGSQHPVDHHVYAICSDGDLMEGVSQEAAGIAGQLGLGKLVLCYDDNHVTIDGTTAISFTAEDHVERFAALGWHTLSVDDSEDLDELTAAIAAGRDERERPSFIKIRSHIAYPAPHAVDTAASHGAALGEDEVRATKEVMGFDPDEHFVVAEEVYRQMDLHERGAALQRGWQQTFDAWGEENPELLAEWERAWAGELEEGWREALPSFDAGKPLASRAAGNTVMQAFAPYAPTMLGGAADLVESTRTTFVGGGSFSRVHAGRNVPFGIREHGMGAIVNGAAAHGGIVSPYGSTFFTFSDYMRGSIRLSALSKLPVVWAFTHDSVGLGEDGPTHQPVEHFAALRAIPDLWVIRPGDANETAAAWRVALERRDGPVALALSRQGIPTLDRGEVASADGLERGAYVLWDSWDGGGDGTAAAPELILIATGSEVPLTLEAGRRVAADGTRTRVVSMPCWELFEAQAQEYRDSVLPPATTARLSVEPGVTFGWSKWVGDRGEAFGVDHYGASAPGARVLEEFGFTPEGVADRATALLQRAA
jgi:transketolase